MAFVSSFICAKCGEPRQEMIPSGEFATACSACRRKDSDAKKRTHLKGLEALTVEERLRRIEEWIYDYKPQYVPPPRF